MVLGSEINLWSVLSSGFPWWFITIRMGVGGRKRSAFNSDGAKHSKINTDSIRRAGVESVSQCTKTAVPSFDGMTGGTILLLEASAEVQGFVIKIETVLY